MVCSADLRAQVLVEPLGDQDEGISVLSLNRPAARNALGRQLLHELKEALDVLRQERTTRCLVIRSLVPGCFSAGADLKVGPASRSLCGSGVCAVQSCVY